MKRLLLMLLLCVAPVSQAEIAVVVSKSFEMTALTDKEVANIFLSRTKRFPNGLKAQPVELKSADLRVPFYETIAGKTPTQLSAYWTTLIFTGKGRPPAKYESMDELILDVENSPGKIAYLPISLVTEGMKVVYTLKP